MTSKCLLVDGKNLLYKACWGNQSLMYHNRHVGGIYGFIRTLLALHKNLESPEVQVCWEGSRNWRYSVYPDYKAGRRREKSEYDFDTSAEVTAQTPYVMRVLAAAGVPQWRPDDGECDDVLFTISQDILVDGGSAYIHTDDRDLYQAVEPFCKIVQTTRERHIIVGSADVRAELGVPPRLVPAYKALVGDSSDNYPGVRGIGPATGAKLLKNHDIGSLLLSAKAGEDWGKLNRFRRSIAQNVAEVETYLDIATLRRCKPEPAYVYETKYDQAKLQHEFKQRGLVGLDKPEVYKQLREFWPDSYSAQF